MQDGLSNIESQLRGGEVYGVEGKGRKRREEETACCKYTKEDDDDE